ncbi:MULTISPECIES: TetR/AcrR family transcriptional regulator [Phenylobacterium]|uniref:AcrR family transcriptional regulator n=1 Tax=Phenylobacterium koreense TaxID=266125 RepID=A0ABV2EFI7_9CAUL
MPAQGQLKSESYGNSFSRPVAARAVQINGLQAKAIAASLTILERDGAEKLNLRAIADQAGVGVSSIYHYFPSKKDLLLRLASIGLKQLLEAVERSQATNPALTPMRAAAAAFFRFVEEHPVLVSLMFNSRLLAEHEALRACEASIIARYQAIVQADERIPSEQAEEIAFAIWALGRGMAAMMSSHGGRLPPEKAETLRAGARYLIDRSD